MSAAAFAEQNEHATAIELAQARGIWKSTRDGRAVPEHGIEAGMTTAHGDLVPRSALRSRTAGPSTW